MYEKCKALTYWQVKSLVYSNMKICHMFCSSAYEKPKFEKFGSMFALLCSIKWKQHLLKTAPWKRSIWLVCYCKPSVAIWSFCVTKSASVFPWIDFQCKRAAVNQNLEFWKSSALRFRFKWTCKFRKLISLKVTFVKVVHHTSICYCPLQNVNVTAL